MLGAFVLNMLNFKPFYFFQLGSSVCMLGDCHAEFVSA
ncbi:hypothetical protein SAMN05444008_102139 [Cnuella takakiae]|uniref:Uncharacterized protein n=1 Tax=Cnuella takakiae TaxID=1302690 RepID=A0A1M4V508_9BACT|nr:hypothetical protein SAMN05444008_102139 [Cnuella takakiae]